MTLAIPQTKLPSKRELRRVERDNRRLVLITDKIAERPGRDALQGLVASAADVRVMQNFGTTSLRWGQTDWQQELWLHYDSCPEFHSGVGIGANNLTRGRLIGVDVDPATGEPATQPTTNPYVTALMSQLFGGPASQGQALGMLYKHLDVAADCWVLASDRPDPMTGAKWQILATGEVTVSASGRQINIMNVDGSWRPIDNDNEALFRIWQAHPRHRWEADSSGRSLLPVLRELAALTAMVSATVKSRLASAGILWIPDEIMLPKSSGESGNDANTQTRQQSPGAAGWLDLLTEAMTAPIHDPDSASAVVPMVATVRADMIEKINHMTFGAELDAMIEPLRESGVKRLAIGMNLPPEILLGLGDVNHWTAWAITEEYAKAYLAPKLELIAEALTTQFLRPALDALGVDSSAFAIYFDLDRLVPKQISVENAQAAYDAGLLSEIDYMQALGFSKAQIASNEERARTLVIEMLRKANPQVLSEIADSIATLFPGIAIQQLTPSGGLGPPVGSTVDDSGTGPAPTAIAPAQSPPSQTPAPTATPPNAGGA